MAPEILTALIAGGISIVGFLINYVITLRTNKKEEQRWQENFRAELRRNLVQESTLEIMRRRMQLYGEVWKALKVTAGYEWKKHTDQEGQKEMIQQLADYLTDVSYSETGLLMSDRSRRLILNLRVGCGQFLKGAISSEEIKNRAYLLKHSMRGDLGIIDYQYESDLNEVAHRLGKVDDWEKKIMQSKM
jgi:hypothetical protein